MDKHFQVGQSALTLGFTTIFVDVSYVMTWEHLFIFARTMLRHIAPRQKQLYFTITKKQKGGYNG